MNQYLDILDDQFDKKANSYVFYFSQGHKLKVSGDFLYLGFLRDFESLSNGEDPVNLHLLDVLFPCLLLYGLAIENLLKSIILISGNDLFEHGKIKNKYKTHDLIVLSNSTGLKWNINYQEVLTLLSDCIVWMGKYTVPTRRANMKWPSLSGSTIKDINSIYQRLEDRLCVSFSVKLITDPLKILNKILS